MQVGVEALVSIGLLLAGAVAYLIKVERTLARIDTSLAAFCGESQRDRTQLWKTLTESKDDHHQLAQDVEVLKTKVAMIPTGNQRGPKPA